MSEDEPFCLPCQRIGWLWNTSLMERLDSCCMRWNMYIPVLWEVPLESGFAYRNVMMCALIGSLAVGSGGKN